MAKIQFSDVTPPERRSIRSIPIPNSGKRKTAPIVKPVSESNVVIHKRESFAPVKETVDIAQIKNDQAYEYYYPKEEPVSDFKKDFSTHSFGGGFQSKKRFVFGGVAILAIIAFIVLMMTVFASATVAITPKSQNLQVDMSLVGTQEFDENTVRYEVIKLSKSQTTSVKASGEESVKLEARGKLMIYNNFSTDPQRLIVRTRFESPEGLIYRIPESVVVPGKVVKNGVETPGSLEVEVFADEPGEKYNIKKTDFTIPGFKSDSVRYKNFYARSITEMAGGFVGVQKTVLPADKQIALKGINEEIQTNLQKELESKVPEGLILLPGSIIFDTKELPQTEESSSVLIGQQVDAYAILLNSQDLAKKVVGNYLRQYSDWNSIEATIADFSSLKITKKPESIVAGQRLDLQIVGQAKMTSLINTTSISQKLVGIQRKDVAKIMDEFAGIAGITVTLRPIWKQSFPDNVAKIKVKIENPK